MVVYTDKNLYGKLINHPGLSLDTDHPCVKMKRYAKDGKSIFKITEQDAIKLYSYYKNVWDSEIYDEFSDYVSDFKEILGGSFCEKNLDHTIEELLNAREVERELLKSLT